MSHNDRLGIKHSIRWALIAIVAAALLPLFAATSGANASTTNQLLQYLKYSTSPNRSNPQTLNNATTNAANLYVFVDPQLNSRIARVDFYIDQVYGGTVRGIDHTDYSAPFDLMGPTSKDAPQAQPWNTSRLARGTHMILAAITWNDKSKELAGASFVAGSTTGSTTTSSPASTTTTSHGTTTSSSAPTTTTTSPVRNSNVFGLSTGAMLWATPPAQMDHEFAGMSSLGATWVRTTFNWSTIEPRDANHDDWTKADALVAAAQKYHVSLILQFGTAPRWAMGGSGGAFPHDPAVYARFAAKVADRYKGKVRVYELGNEPNHLKSFPHPDTQLYVNILKVTYPAMKAADPNSIVLTAGVGGGETKFGQVPGDVFVQQLYADGGKNYFDGIAYHPYTYPLTPTQDLLTGHKGWFRMLNARQAMVANGDGNKKIWITEFGAPTNGDGGVTPDQQANTVQDAYTLWQSYSWAGPLCWFDYQDKGTDTSTHKDWFGLLTASGARKPSAATYQRLANQ